MFGSGSMIKDYSNWENSPSSNSPQAIIDGLADGTVEKKNVDQAATRILRFKFNKGLFENPYCDVQNALEICASAEWAATATVDTVIANDEDLRAARNPYEVELTEELQAKAAVLVKNDNNLLPLKKDAKIYLDTSSASTKEAYSRYFTGKGATLVEDMEEADVVVGDFGSINDAAELFIEDAQDAGKPIVLSLNNTKPTQYALENADAVLYLSYSQAADHGSTEGGFLTGTSAWIYADLIFGDRVPGGVINKEIARDTVADNEQWKDLAGDQGASPYVRLMIQATMEDDANHASPNNWGDPLVTYQFGMTYGKDPEFVYSCLIVPLAQETVEVESGSSTTTQTNVWNQAKAGEPFTIYALLRNKGEGDGITTVEAKVNGETAAKKIMTVDAGSWRVVQMDITIAEPGSYTVSVGTLSAEITIAE
jgi:outer membrane lipoprotein-sorting protein